MIRCAAGLSSATRMRSGGAGAAALSGELASLAGSHGGAGNTRDTNANRIATVRKAFLDNPFRHFAVCGPGTFDQSDRLSKEDSISRENAFHVLLA